MFRWILSYILLSHYLQSSHSMTSRIIIPRALSEVSTTSPTTTTNNARRAIETNGQQTKPLFEC